jgi:hypothetical protein
MIHDYIGTADCGTASGNCELPLVIQRKPALHVGRLHNHHDAAVQITKRQIPYAQHMQRACACCYDSGSGIMVISM